MAGSREADGQAVDNDNKGSEMHVQQQPRCLACVPKGVRTAGDLSRFLGALMLDVIDGRVSHRIANSSVRAAESLIKISVKQVEYGMDPSRDLRVRDFKLCSDLEEEQ